MRKLYIIGDIHGEFDALWICLRKIAKVIDEQGKWIGGDSVVVQLGDLVDSWRFELSKTVDSGTEKQIINLLKNLHKQAVHQGGEVITVLGNHDITRLFRRHSMFKKIYGSGESFSPDNKKELDKTLIPGQQYGRILGYNSRLIYRYGDVLMVHGGLNIEYLKRAYRETGLKGDSLINFMNKKLQDITYYGYDKNIPSHKYWLKNIAQRDSMIFYRPNQPCEYCTGDIDEIFEFFDIDPKKGKIVVAHTNPNMICSDQLKCLDKALGGIRSACDRRLWYIDVGMSKAFDRRDEIEKGDKSFDLRRPQVLRFECRKASFKPQVLIAPRHIYRNYSGVRLNHKIKMYGSFEDKKKLLVAKKSLI